MTRANSLFVVAMVAASAVLIGTTANAQRGGPPGGGFGSAASGGLSLLRSEQVQKELNLIDEQKEQLSEMTQKVFGNMREQYAGLRDMEPAARDAKMAELRKQTEQKTAEAQKEVEKILMPQQLERLRGIRLQVEGLTALSDPGIATEVGLTAQQKAQIQALLTAAADVARQGFSGMGDLSPEERKAKFAENRDKMAKVQQELTQKITALLTPQQKQTMEQMKGAKFELDMSQMRRPGGPPPAP